MTTRLPLAALVVAALTAALGGLSRVHYTPGAPSGAVIRLSWRARGERVESCRKLSRSELADLPEHMRQPEICDDVRVAPYTLAVAVDGREIIHGATPGSGTRGTRPMYMLRDIPVPAGPHRVAVALFRTRAPAASGDAHGTGRESHVSHGERREEDDARGAIPPSLALDTTVTLRPDEIVLVTYDTERRALTVRGEDGSARQ